MQSVRTQARHAPRYGGIPVALVAAALACTAGVLHAQARTTKPASTTGPATTTGQATITAITVGDQSLSETAEVERTPFATVRRESVKVGTILQVDDELRSMSDAVVTELNCRAGARILLSGAFRILVQPAEAAVECVFRLTSGGVDVQSERPASVEFGEVTLGVEHTQYTVRIGSPDSAGTTRVVVFDGDVVVRTVAGEAQRVSAGGGRAVLPGGLQITELTRNDIQQTAVAFARMDVAQTRPASPEQAREARARLERQYALVLASPTDARRLQLAATQLAVGVTPRASLYQLTRTRPPDTDTVSRAKLGYLTGLAHSRIGDTARATREFQGAERLNSTAVEGLIREYHLESPAYRAVMVRPRQDPRTIRNSTRPD